MPVVVEGNVMKGPGVYDMKVGLAQIVYALKALHELDIRPELAPIVFITSDEETGSLDSRKEIESLARTVDRVFIPEPSTGPEGKIKTARKGVGAFTIIVKGKSAHAGVEPEKGISAVLELPALIESLQALNAPREGVTLNIGLLRAGTGTNIVPDRCEIGVDVRVPTQADAARIDEAIRNLTTRQPGTQLEIRGGIERPPMEKTPRNQALWKAARKLGRQLNLELEESYTGGGSDGNLTSPLTATLDGLGGVGGGAHARHEFIFLDKMLERTALLALLLTLPRLRSTSRDPS
jgi:glutamate carboxypeptidase